MNDRLTRLREKTATIGIVGLGYVGLPLVISFTTKGYSVIGFDIDVDKIEKIQKGESYIKHIPNTPIESAINNSQLEAFFFVW